MGVCLRRLLRLRWRLRTGPNVWLVGSHPWPVSRLNAQLEVSVPQYLRHLSSPNKESSAPAADGTTGKGLAWETEGYNVSSYRDCSGLSRNNSPQRFVGVVDRYKGPYKASQASEKHERFQWSADALTVPRRPHQGLGCPFTLYDRERWSGDRRTERPLWFIVELRQQRSSAVNNIIYIIGLVVVVIAVLSFFGLR